MMCKKCKLYIEEEDACGFSGENHLEGQAISECGIFATEKNKIPHDIYTTTKAKDV